MELKKIIEKYEPYFMVILVISAILSALNFLGFDTNIFRWPHYYSTLDYDSKIFLVGALNIIFTLLMSYIVIRKVRSKQN